MRACFAIALDTQMKHGSVKAKCFGDNLVKMTADAKIFVWTSYKIWFIKRMVQ